MKTESFAYEIDRRHREGVHWVEGASNVVEILGELPFDSADDRVVEQLMSERLGSMKLQKLFFDGAQW